MFWMVIKNNTCELNFSAIFHKLIISTLRKKNQKNIIRISNDVKCLFNFKALNSKVIITNSYDKNCSFLNVLKYVVLNYILICAFQILRNCLGTTMESFVDRSRW